MSVQIEADEVTVSFGPSKNVTATITFQYAADHRQAAENLLSDLSKSDALLVVREVLGDLGDLLDKVEALSEPPSEDEVAELKSTARQIRGAR